MARTEPSRSGEGERAGAVVVKRSVVVAGHRTSVSLEDAFWRRLKTIATLRESSVNALVAEIDRERADANLSSAIRVFVLNDIERAEQPQ
jgi:predicted DNA-binding ribbon-helix-helix protein